MPALLLPLSLAITVTPSFARDDTPPPPPSSGIGTSPTAARSESAVTPVATVTELPPWLRGDIALHYGYDRLGGHLTEAVLETAGATESADVEVGQRTISSHVVNVDAVFCPGPGVGITLGFPIHASDTVSFATSQAMVYDPSTGSGTMNSAQATDVGQTAKGSGLEGVWIGIAGTPFSETFERRKNRASWKIAGAIRTPNKDNFYVESDGKRGAGTGGLGVRLDNAFSTTIGGSQPYLTARYQANGKATLDVTDADGNVVPTEYRAPREATIRFGSEFLAARNDEKDTNVRVDLHGVFDYTSWGTVPSGTYLPEVLDGTERVAVQQSESAALGGGLGFSFQPSRYFSLGFFGEVAYHLPQRIESPYPIYTAGDTVKSLAGLHMTVRIR